MVVDSDRALLVELVFFVRTLREGASFVAVLFEGMSEKVYLGGTCGEGRRRMLADEVGCSHDISRGRW